MKISLPTTLMMTIASYNRGYVREVRWVIRARGLLDPPTPPVEGGATAASKRRREETTSIATTTILSTM